MDILEQISRTWIAWMLSASWQLMLLVCVVAAAARLARGASPRLRYGLWMLVLLKVFLPPSMTTPFSAGRWVVAPVVNSIGLADVVDRLDVPWKQPQAETFEDGDERPRDLPIRGSNPRLPVLLLFVWSLGGLLFWMVVANRYVKVRRVLRAAYSIDEGPIRVALEQIALALKLREVPDLLATDVVTSPFLLGTTRPCIVLPNALLAQLNELDLQAVLTHELVHWKRRDTWVGWLQVLVQSIFWFHPAVWWANWQLRHQRECVCDEMVLRLGRITPRHYGESILRVLTVSRARSLVAGSLVGVFEPGAKLQSRLEDIMSYEPAKREFTWAARGALAAFAVMFLPMAPGFVPAPLAAAERSETTKRPADADGESGKKPYPQIVRTIPEQGATSVDPDLTEISVTFDRDMRPGMSWTGAAPLLPTIDESRQARWTDARTCVLPVRLKKGTYYRVGINSTSYENFRDSAGVPAPCSVIAFATRGATRAVERRVRAPKILEIVPENGAREVDPETSSLRVTFDIPMGDGMSWTGGGSNFPSESPDGKKASWSKDGRTCTLPVLLEAGHDYELGLNSTRHINFQSKWGVPLEPVVYRFRTQDAKE